MKREKRFVGQSLPRREGMAKVSGQAKYVDDLSFPDMLYGVTVRSPKPRGKIKNILFAKPIPWDEVVVVTAQDIPGANHVALIAKDQPYLADQVVNHPQEPIVLLAHADKYLLEAARRSVHIEIESLPPVLTMDESDNVFKSYQIDHGDCDSAWQQAATRQTAARQAVQIVEGEYHTEAQEQLYIECQGMIAKASPREGVTIWGSMQCPYYIHKALQELFALPAEKVRIIQTETGGGFGGKEEYPSMIAGHAALLAWKSGKPVKIIYDRQEDMAATTKRHPSRTRIKTAVDRNGKLLAQDIDFCIDGGAYVTLSPVVLSRGTLHASGPYFCPHVRIRSKAVATNVPPHGAFRGFGAPQSLFAMERHMDRVARQIGLAPDEFRRRNFIKEGETFPTGQVMRDEIRLDRLLDRALALSDFHRKRKAFARQNPQNPVKKGIGLASFMHGAGFTGSGEVYLASVVTVSADGEGKVFVQTSSTEIGQGTNTIFTQIAADALGLPCDRIAVVVPDTAHVPNSGPTVASRTAMVVGDLVGKACLDLKRQLIEKSLLQEKYTPADFTKACAAFIRSFGKLNGVGRYQAPPGIEWDEARFRGDAYAAYAWAVYVAAVSVDTITYQIQVDDFVAVQEIGRVLNPVLAAGQVEGGIAQAIGYALYEKVVWEEGQMINNQMTNYIMPTSADLPRIRVYFEEVPYRHGFSGAKGVGELPMDGPAPAILNAVSDATGAEVNKIPLLPEDLLAAMEANDAHR